MPRLMGARCERQKSRPEMKKLLLTGVATLLLATGTAQAGKFSTFLTSKPPAEYDKPYMGELMIRRMATEQDMRNAFPKAPFKTNAQSHAPAISFHNETRCEVFIVSDRTLKALGMNYALTLRHELAHCNGWPADHPGAKKVPVDTKVEMPKLPASTKELLAYPPIVCVTPDWKSEPCESRKAAAMAGSRLPAWITRTYLKIA